MKTQISIKTGEKIVDVSQDFESLVIVVQQALGGGKSGAATSANTPKTASDVEALLSKHLG